MPHPVQLPNTLEKSIDISAPLSKVYKQWTQFEDYPQFMEGVREVTRVGEQRLHWRAVIGGREREWDAAIVEQTPDTRITWQSADTPVQSGMASFTTVYGGTRVTLQMTLDPEEIPDDAGSAKEVMTRRVEGNLQRFKEFIESRGAETGVRRGKLNGGQTARESPEGRATAVRAGRDNL